MTIPEVILYKYYNSEDIDNLKILSMSASGHTKLSDGTYVSKLPDGRVELEIIEKDYEVEG